MNVLLDVDAGNLLKRVAEQVPAALRPNVVVIGSIATAWAFRDVSGTDSVTTKDIDLLLRPAITAVATAETLGGELLHHGWTPQYTHGRAPGDVRTPDDDLPALRLSPPESREGWFVELLAEPPADQGTRKHWRRFETELGVFGLPSFRYMRVAVFGAAETDFGLRVATPACMALAHLLEHADPDRTPISNIRGGPPRFVKDVGRAISLWWLAQEQSATAGELWLNQWNRVLAALYPEQRDPIKQAARSGLLAIAGYLAEAHAIARNGVLAPHGTSLDAFRRAQANLLQLIEEL